MHGAVLGALIVGLILLVAAIFASPWFLIPAVLMGAFFLLTGPIAGAARGTGGDRDGSGTPSTSEASYDPVSRGGQRTA
jgi:hypothetical protein